MSFLAFIDISFTTFLTVAITFLAPLVCCLGWASTLFWRRTSDRELTALVICFAAALAWAWMFLNGV